MINLPVKSSSRFSRIPEGALNIAKSKLNAVRKELESAGKQIIPIEGGDPTEFGFVNQPLSDALIEAARKGLHRYPHETPYQVELRESIVDFEKKYRGCDYTSDEIILTPGVAGAFQVIHYSLLDAGDEIATFEPCHYLLAPSLHHHILGSKVVSCRSFEEKEWEFDLEGLRERINERTKGIVISNPSNPTGKVYDENALKKLIDVAGEYDLPIISDEIYGLLTFDGVEAKSISAVAGDVPTIVLTGMSKVFMRTGWRVGYLAFHDPRGKNSQILEVAKKMAGLYGHATSCIPTPILYAAARAFRGSVEPAKEMMQKLQARRDLTYKRLNDIDGMSCTKPEGGFYAFPHVHSIGETWKSDDNFILELLMEEGVLIPFYGSSFGRSGFGHFRALLLPKPEELEEAYNRLERFMKSHSKE